MLSYQQVFGGGLVYPSDASYSGTALSASATLRWPTEIGSTPLACAIMDVSPSTPGVSITLPDATLVSVGENILFNNVGLYTVNILKSDGTQIVSIPPSTVWQVYLTDNSTAGGTWNTFQFGAGVSVATSGALAGAGLVAAGSTLSQSVPVVTLSTDYTTGSPDQAKALVWTGGNGTFTVPSATTVGASWFTHIKNGGSGTLTVAPQGGSLIDGTASMSLAPGESFLLACDGSSFYTIGRGGTGSTTTAAFTFMTVPVPGSGVYPLTPVQYANSALRFTGALLGARDVVVPNVTGSYYIDNQTTGAFPLTIKTAAGTGYTVPQGSRMIVFCDGTNVVDAVSLGTSGGLIPISSGGTGATTQPAALVNLGGTTLGTTIFTAPSAPVARAALGASATGDAVFASATPLAARTALGSTTVGDAVFTAATPLAARTAIGAVAEDDALMFALAFG